MDSRIQTLLDRVWRHWRPPPRLSVSQWAGQFRQLSPEASAEPGQWYNTRAPHTVAPMDALSPSDPCETVILKWSSQIGKTEVLNNFVGYVIDQDPGPMLVVQPNVEPMAEAWSKDRLAPMLRDTPVLQGRVADSKGRDSNNTILHKAFPGGHVTIGGANSPAGLASRPIRFLCCDEINRYAATKEGDPVRLAKKRTQTFWNRKILLISSPTYEDEGIDAEYQGADQQNERQIQCDKCEKYQFPGLRHFQWDKGNLDTLRFVCEFCSHEHGSELEPRLKASAQWVVVKDTPNPRSKAYWMNQFCSPFAEWRGTILEFLDAKGDSQKLQTFVNTALAENWSEPGEVIDSASLIGRRETYPAEAPQGAAVLTAGVDIQDDRIEMYVYGWGPGEETWAIDAMTLYGNPDQIEVWNDLDDALQASWAHESGSRVGISACCVDSGAHTAMVYEFCRTRQARRIFSVKGVGGEGRPLVGSASPKKTGRDRRPVSLFPLGVDDAKALLHSRLQITEPGPGYWHMPANHALFNEEYCAQLTAEKRVTRYSKGFAVREWKKIRPRNEALDCAIYALAALRLLNPRWEQLREQLANGPASSARPMIRRRRSRYLDN